MFSLDSVLEEYPNNYINAITNVVSANMFDSLSILALEWTGIIDFLEKIDDDVKLMRLYKKEEKIRCYNRVDVTFGEALYFIAISYLDHFPLEQAQKAFPKHRFYVETLLNDTTTDYQPPKDVRVVYDIRDVVDDLATVILSDNEDVIQPYYSFTDVGLLTDYFKQERMKGSGVFLSRQSIQSNKFRGWLVNEATSYCDFEEYEKGRRKNNCTLTNSLRKFKKATYFEEFEQMFWNVFPEETTTFVSYSYLDECFPTEDEPYSVGNKIIRSAKELSDANVFKGDIVRKYVEYTRMKAVYVVFCSFKAPLVFGKVDEAVQVVERAIQVLEQFPLPPKGCKFGYSVLKVVLVLEDVWKIYGTVITNDYPPNVISYIENEIIIPTIKTDTSIVPIHLLTTEQEKQLSDVFKTPSLMRNIGKGDPWTDSQIDKFFTEQRVSAYERDIHRKYFDWCLIDGEGNVLTYVSIRPFEGDEHQMRIISRVPRKGYARRSIYLAENLFTKINRDSYLRAVVNPQNVASVRLFESLGWKEERKKKIGGKLMIIYVSR